MHFKSRNRYSWYALPLAGALLMLPSGVFAQATAPTGTTNIVAPVADENQSAPNTPPVVQTENITAPNPPNPAPTEPPPSFSLKNSFAPESWQDLKSGIK